MARDIHVDIVERRRGHALRDVARDLDRTTDELHDFNAELNHSGRTSAELDRKLHVLRRSVRDLGAEYVRTGNKDVLPDLNRDRRQLAQLARIKREMGDLSGRGRGGGWLGSGIDFSQGLSEARGILIGGLVLGIVEALPAISAMLAGAVTGAVGAGGVVGGVVAAAQDPRVKHAFTDAISGFSAEDFGATAFVRPTIGAIKELEAALHRADFAKVLAPAAKYVEPLAKGLGGLVERFGPRLEQTLKNAAPFIAVMEKELPEVGDALGQMFEQMSEGKGAVEGLQFFFGVLDGTLRGVGQTVHWLSERFYDMTTTATRVTGLLAKIGGPQQFLFAQMHQDLVDFRNQADEAQQGAKGLSGVMSRLATGSVHLLTDAVASYNVQLGIMIQNTKDYLDLTMDQDRQAIAWQEDLDALAESVKENGKGLDLFSEKGRTNRSHILDLIEDARAMFETNQRLGMSFQDNTRLLETQIDRIKWHAYHLGLDKKAVDALVNRYIIEIQVRTYAFGPLANYINQIFGKGIKIGGFQLFGSATVSPNDFSGGSTSAGVPGLAGGGNYGPHMPFIAGEHGAELIYPGGMGGTVLNHGATMAALGGGSNITVSFAPSGDPLIDAVMNVLRDRIRVQYGGDVQAGLGRTSR